MGLVRDALSAAFPAAAPAIQRGSKKRSADDQSQPEDDQGMGAQPKRSDSDSGSDDGSGFGGYMKRFGRNLAKRS